MNDLRFPIGKFQFEGVPNAAQKQVMLGEIAQTAANLRASVKGLSDAQLDTEYRPGGWTVRQLVHHVPDSHLNAYVRFKLALTEDDPTMAKWAIRTCFAPSSAMMLMRRKRSSSSGYREATSRMNRALIS